MAAMLDPAATVVTMPKMRLFQFILVLAATFCVPVWSRAEVADGIKAVVNDRAITFAEVEDFTRPAVDALRRQYAGQPEVFQQKVSEALNDSLEQLVERQLIMHSFDTDGYKLPDSVVDELVQERIRERFGDRVTLIKTLQAQGLTFEQFRKQVREQYIESALRNQNVQREVIISPYKVENYYLTHQADYKLDDQVKLRMIVLPKAGAKAGAAFTEMASVYSQGSQQHSGGDWGWVAFRAPQGTRRGGFCQLARSG